MSRYEAPLPAHTWRVLGLAAVGLLVTAMAGIALISAGVFDPQPVGQLQAQSTPGERAAPARDQRIEWRQLAVGQDSYSVRLMAAYAGGERDVGYGLALGSAGQHLVIGVSPLGYVTIWEEDVTGRRKQMPWQTWPHVRLGRDMNEIQIDVRDGDVAVRLNRELLWQGMWRAPEQGVGLYTQSFGGPGQVYFADLALYYE